MYKEINNSAEALVRLEEALSNNRVSKSHIEDLSAGLQNDNIDLGESVEKNFNPNKYSNSPSNISLYEAAEVAEIARHRLSTVADGNKIEAFKSAISSITNLQLKVSHLVKTKNPNMETFNKIKDYYNRPKKGFVVTGNDFKEEITSEFIPFFISNNMEQVAFLRSISDVCQSSREAFAKVAESNVEFFPMLNWVSNALKDPTVMSGSEFSNWELLFNSTSISNINIVNIIESIVDGRLLNLIELTKKALEQELSYELWYRVDAIKNLTIAKDDVIKLDPIRFSRGLDKLYKDIVSTSVLELLFYSIYSVNKE